ncbi:hypothetical protein GCQ56_06525 [Marinifilum sp. N1E240]|uniref:hypothetical protein n=1 Tax=Marinifilum sp. N1E240 TaxID=2608082 RepID=UPI00128DD616|nr:hypothetical protein [Marinifilum sp. N1E240]MPQ46664.1 hypothetical protein [Marinifilum sp. N1E240]
MTNKTKLMIGLLAVLVFSVGGILLINNSDILNSWEANSISLLKQYLKVIGFLSIMAMVYVRMRNAKKEVIEEQED